MAQLVNNGVQESTMVDARRIADLLGLHCRIELRELDLGAPDSLGTYCFGVTARMKDRYVVYLNYAYAEARGVPMVAVLAHEFRHVWQQESNEWGVFILHDRRRLADYFGPLKTSLADVEGARLRWHGGAWMRVGAWLQQMPDPSEEDAHRWGLAFLYGWPERLPSMAVDVDAKRG